MNKKVIAFSSEYDSENGQAVVTRRVLQQVLFEVDTSVHCIYPSGSSFRSIGAWVATCWTLWWRLCTYRVEVIYVVCSRTTLGFIRDLPALLMAFLGNRIVVHCHGSDLEGLLSNGWLSGIVKVVYSRCEVIVPCRMLGERIKDNVMKVHICENFFGDESLQTFVSSKNYSHLSIIWNSNIMSSKGFFDVVSAVDELVCSGHRIELLCYGKVLGDYEMSEDNVRRELVKYNESDWFTYLGPIDHFSAVRALQNADAVILPSRYTSEMQPLAIIEAMCASKRIIVSDTASLRATVGNYPADFVPIGNVAAIAKCMERLYTDKLSNPKEFFIGNRSAAALAKERFCTARFDAEMTNILVTKNI